MGVRLNGWQRIGVIVSIAWSIGAAIHEDLAISNREDTQFSAAFGPVYNQCRDNGYDGSDCAREAAHVASKVPPESRWNIAVQALAPIPFGWLLVYLTTGVVRWVKRGFSDG
jgi:hypothetical protein